AGHDLVIEVSRWSGEVSETAVTVTAEAGSLRVVEGRGGAIPLSERDKREIAVTARKILQADRSPEITFTSTEVTGDLVEGTLTILGRERPFRLQVVQPGENRYRGTGTVTQSEYGIKPYTAMLGALKLADAVAVEAEVDLS
ncbi:YceI family protein, partial [Kibdelosporangium lantanae]